MAVAGFLSNHGLKSGAGGKAVLEKSSAEQASGVARTVVEAALLSALAFGCAQAGWAVLAAPNAEATAQAIKIATPTNGEAGQVDQAILSPFSVAGAGVEGTDLAAEALVSNLKLVGVRVSTEKQRSSAIFIRADGAQASFQIGEDIGDGVALSDVAPGYVVVSFSGIERKVAMAPPAVSFAQALMSPRDKSDGDGLGMTGAVSTGLADGRVALSLQVPRETGLTPVDAQPVSVAASKDSLAPTPFSVTPPSTLGSRGSLTSSLTVRPGFSDAAASASAVASAQAGDAASAAQARAWLAQIVSQRLAAGDPVSAGWILPGDTPAAVRAIRLRPGDVIMRVNGVDTTQAVAVLAAATSGGPVTLSLRRDGVDMVVVAPAPPQPGAAAAGAL